MTQILLIRHAVNDYVKTGKLAGWIPGVHLNDEGKAQAVVLGERLQYAPIKHIYASPLERTMETAEAIVIHHPHLQIEQNAEIGEVRYGDWEGEKLSTLRQRKMWELVQHHPSRAYFPNGETMRDVQIRAVNAIEKMVENHPAEMIAVVSHADVLKMVLAHYLGMHLDNFQRLDVSPASISILSLGFGRPYVPTINDVAHIRDMERKRKAEKADS